MPATQTQLPIPGVTAEDFEHILETNSYVALSKLLDSEGNIILATRGYRMVQIAQNLGLYLTSSEEWGKSRKYFQDNPDREFRGKTGREIENGYISGHVEQTSSLLSFKANGQYPRDTHDLLKGAGFDGMIALIDFPYVQEDDNEFIFTKSPRIKIRDVTEISGKPLPIEDGYAQGYDWDTGLITEVGPNPNQEYNAYYWIIPDGTRMVFRSRWTWPGREDGRFGVDAHWGPSSSYGGVSARLSSGNEPLKILASDRTRIVIVKQEVLRKLDELEEKYNTNLQNISSLGPEIKNLRKFIESI